MYRKLPEKAEKPLLIRGDAFEEIKLFRTNTFDSLVMDLPYLIGFMGLKWDKKEADSVNNYVGFFKECIRVLKHGAYMLIFTGSVNYDLFVNWCRLAGFEVKPQLSWVYTSGMPHGVDYVKYLIKQDHWELCDAWDVTNFEVEYDASRAVVEPEIQEQYTLYRYNIRVEKTLDVERYADLEGWVPKMFEKFIDGKRSTKTSKDFLLSKLRLLHAEYFGYSVITYDFIEDSDSPTGWIYRALLRNRSRDEKAVSGMATDFMRFYDGFNSGLKPANEPIAMLRKPNSEAAIVANAMRWGTGGLNIKDCRLPLDGMENVNVYDVIQSLKVKVGLLPPSDVEETDVQLIDVMDDMNNLVGTREGKDSTFGNTTIRDRLNSGGGGNKDLAKAVKSGFIKDFVSQADSLNRRSKSYKGGQSGDKVFREDISDAISGGGRAFPDPDHERLIKDLESQIVGFDMNTNKANTMEGFSDGLHATGNLQSEDVSDLVKFIKGSHPMHGSSGSGVYAFNDGEKSIKADTDKAIETAKQLHRKVNLKKSGSGILEVNKEKDLTEEEMRLLGDMKDMTTRHDPSKHKGAFWGNADQPMDNKKFTILSFFDKMWGRFPSNVIMTESDGFRHARIPPKRKSYDYDKYFVVSKPTTKEKLAGVPKKYENELHKTVKPIRLMLHLVKLVSPRGIVNPLVGDFFMGSGTTIVAAKSLGIRAVGVEIDTTYYKIARHRAKNTPVQRRLRF